MANQEHVEIVKQGAAAIAKWRESHPELRLDLIEADLRRSDLAKVDLSAADLRGAKLMEADLSRSDLREANLSNADLSGGNLKGTILIDAKLFRANLSRSDLSGAKLIVADLAQCNMVEVNLSGADLTEADLTGAVLTGAVLIGTQFPLAKLISARIAGADFRNAFFAHTVIVDTELSAARYLETCRHAKPSSIGTDTLELSRGRIPEAFLRGCGVSDVLIAYLPSLIGEMQPIQYHSCFISYSYRDEDFAKRMHGRLEQEHLRVWYAPEDMKGGRKIYHQIDEAIRIHDKLLLVLSPESMRSPWVETEIRRTLKAEREQGRQKLFPIRLCSMNELREWTCFDSDSGRDLAVEVREYHIPAFTQWKEHDAFEAAFARLLEDLRTSEE